MSAFLGLDNPIFFAQFSARGGWRRIGWITGAYVAALAAVIALTAYDAYDAREVLTGWLDGLLGLQLLMLVGFGTSRVSLAVRNDIKDHMIESHRLMPMSRESAVLGYLFGGPVQALALGAANLVLGLVICPLTHKVDPFRWLVANAMIASIALMLWAIAAQIAFSVRGGILVLIIGAIAVTGNISGELSLFPALSLLLDPIIGHSVFELRVSLPDLWTIYGLPFIGQMVIGGIFLVAATRKYRSADGVGFNTTLGLMLLAAIVGLSVAAIWVNVNHPRRFYYRNDEPQRFANTLLDLLLFSLVPLAAVAQSYAPRVGRRTSRIVGVTILCVMLNLVPLCRRPDVANRNLQISIHYTVLVVAATIASMAAVFTWAYAVRKVSWPFMVPWLLLIWVGPMVAQGIVTAAQQSRPASGPEIGMISPVLALSAIWRDDPSLAWFGIQSQVALAVIPIGLAALRLSVPSRRSRGTANLATPAA